MIKDILDKISPSRLRNLPPRDQLLYFGGAAAVVLILYLSFLLPIQHELSRLRTTVPQEKVQLALMQVQALEANQLRASGHQPASGGNLLASIEQSATASGLRQRISRMEPEGANGARLSLESVDFNAMIGWLAKLQTQGGVRVERASIEPLPLPGTVNAKLTLRGTGA